MLTKKEVKQVKKIRGKVRGAVFQTDIKYVRNKSGKSQAEEVKKKIEEIEPELDWGSIKNTDWYPLKWRILMLLIIKDVCGWKDKDIYEMGRHAPLNSFVVKIILRYFTSWKKTCQEASTYWEKHYSRGRFETVEFNDSKKYVIFRLRKFRPHPVLCNYLKGFFQGMAEMTNANKNNRTQETKCAFDGYRYHEFIIKWD